MQTELFSVNIRKNVGTAGGIKMYPVISIGKYELSTYWTIFAFAIIVMLIFNLVRRTKYNYNFTIANAVFITIFNTIISFLGAHLLYIIESLPVTHEQIFSTTVSFYGALLLVPASCYVLCKFSRKSFGAVMDYVTPGLLSTLGLIRIGCFLNGCCGGRKISFILNGKYSYPTQIIESVFDSCLLFFLLRYEKKNPRSRKLYLFLMLYYSIMRFFIEFIRNTAKHAFLSNGQILAFVVANVALFIIVNMREKV